jgi:hypothetical protein
MAVEDNRNVKETQRNGLRLTLSVVRDNSDENKRRWKIIATEIDGTEQIKAEIH